MIQLNLLPDLKKEYIKSQKTKGLVVSVSIVTTIVAVGLSVAMLLYINFVQQIQINVIDDDIKNKTAELKNIPNLDKYLTIQNQLAALPDLHRNKGYYSRLFDFLTVMNPSPPNSVTISNLEVDVINKTIGFSGTAGSYESMNVFVDTLKNVEVSYNQPGATEQTKEKLFTQVLVQSSSLSKVGDKDRASFTIATTYQENVFMADLTDVKASVPSITTTPSVTEAPAPTQLFNSNSGGQ